MKRNFVKSILLISLLFQLTSTLAFAQAGIVTVGCPGGTPGTFNSLSQAVFSSPDNTTFKVSGTCTEAVIVQNRNVLSFTGNPSATIQAPDPSLETVGIFSSKSITFRNGFALSGGQGLIISNSSNILFQGITVQSSQAFGITSVNSQVNMDTSTVTGNTRTGVVLSGGIFGINGGVTISNNGRIGLSAGGVQVNMNDGLGPNIVSHNGLTGIQLFDLSLGDLSGDNEITNNGGPFGILILTNSDLEMGNGIVNNNVGVGVHCDGTTHCEFSGTHIDGNSGGGIEIVNHSDAAFDGGMDVSSNIGTGVLVDQSSSLNSLGGNTISNNSGDGLILNFLSALNFAANDVITASPGNLALNCNNGSMVRGDISTYKPKKCGAQFQAGPIH